jgi:CRISPR system Cascade subunit CasC
MSDFLQFHLLTVYPPSNLNRDDLGRPKTAMFGGTQRLRVSSQSLKRAWRTSAAFQSALTGHIGERTQRLGEGVLERMLGAGLDEEAATEVAREIAGQFGKIKPKGVQIEQLAHIGVEERERVEALVNRVIEGHKPDKEELESLLGAITGTVDTALFGRMLAAAAEHNIEASVQVSHALSVHRVTVEDDFFTAVDDLKPREEDVGAGMLGTSEFAASVLYIYLCVDRSLLVENLGGNAELATEALKALVQAAVTVSPSGKQNSYASRARASYLLAERGTQQPRTLASAFLKDVRGADPLSEAVERLEETYKNFDEVYGACADTRAHFNVQAGVGSLKSILDFVGQAV